MKLSPLKHYFESENFSKKTFLQALRHLSPYIVFGIFFVLCGMMAWLLYSYQTYRWSDVEVATFRQEYAGKTSFREDWFARGLDALKNLEAEQQKSAGVMKDIFFGKLVQ
jgi:hypothetical protein